MNAEPWIQDRKFLALTLFAGWVLWLGWMLSSPIPHLRYLWPSLVCFAILAGRGLAGLCRQAVVRTKRPKSFFAKSSVAL